MAWLNSTGWCTDVDVPPGVVEVGVLEPCVPFVWEEGEAADDWEAWGHQVQYPGKLITIVHTY